MTGTIEPMEKNCGCDCELMTSRILNASRERVFGAISDPAQLAQWWGPKGFTNTFQEFDFRTGGTWQFTMRGPDGKTYANKHTFAEIVQPVRVVFKHLSSPRFQLTVTLEDAGAGKTKITWRQRFESAEECARIAKYAVDANEQNLDRLEAHLAKASTARPFIISRTFDAPREQIWKAWSERARLMDWFGPKGFKMPAAKLDFRPGGSFHYCLAAQNGNEMWGKFVYREIVAPEKIVLVSSFSDEAGEITRHPMSATWPLETLSTFTLTEENGRSTATIQWVPLNAMEEEINTFNAAHEGMKQGWTGTFDQLEAYLAKAQDIR
jgi:uncharacterized protein YndB with AHSA1/START domain